MALAEASLEVLRDGSVPSLSALTREISKRLGSEVGPTMEVRPQGRRSSWNLHGMNSSFKETSFDLEVLYKAFVDLASSVLRRLNAIESSSRSQHSQLDRLDGVTRNLLFLLQNGDGYFEGFFDDFHDLSKIDPTQSSVGAVDLSATNVELPQNAPASRKVIPAHLIDKRSWPVEVKTAGQVIRAETPTDSPFSAMFTDVLTAWRYDVITSEGGPISASITFPLHFVDQGAISLSRIQLIGLSESPQLVDLEYSIDSKNWLKFSGAGESAFLDSASKSVNVDFPLTRVELLRVTLHKESHDKTVPTGFLTSFGLKHLGMYSIGRASEAVIVSKPYSVAEGKSIGKVAISSFEEVPAGTDVLYYVSPIRRITSDGQQEAVQGEWTPITPVGRAARQDEPPRLIKLSSVLRKKQAYVPPAPLDPFVTSKGVDYYRLNEDTAAYTDRIVEDDVVFGSAFLFRGRNSWQRQNAITVELSQVSDEYVSFTAGPRQKLYDISRETVNFGSDLPWDDHDRTTMVVSRTIDYRPDAGMSIVPPPEVEPFSVPDPLHSLYQVSLSVPTMEDSETLTLSTSDAVPFTKGPIETAERQIVVEYLSAWDAQRRTDNNDLVTELEARASLLPYHNKIVIELKGRTTPDEVANGKPDLTRITIGGTESDLRSEVDGEITGTLPLSAVPNDKDYADLTDEQLLGLFGRVKFRTTVPAGIIAEDATTPTITFLPRVDFDLEDTVDPQTGLRGLYVRRTTNSRITAGSSVRFKFKYKTNIISHVMAIKDNLIYLDNAYSGFPPGTSIQVAYRFVPFGSNKVRSETVKVSIKPGSDLLIPGKDYYFNPDDGSITALTGGGIYASDGVKGAYVSFSYEGRLLNLYNFATWVYVDSKDPIKIRFSALPVSIEAGEKVSISTGTGKYVEISGTTETPDLTSGWHQVLVASKDPSVHTDSAVQVVAEMIDLDGNPIFLAGGKYFSKMEGSRVAMTQVTDDFLLHSVYPTDTSKFAIDEEGNILVNFQPNSQGEYYTYGYRIKDVIGVPTAVLDHYNEQFDLEYDGRVAETGQVDRVAVRILLRRHGDADAGVTPKVAGYQIRVG